jgi:hypothetical protein
MELATLELLFEESAGDNLTNITAYVFEPLCYCQCCRIKADE